MSARIPALSSSEMIICFAYLALYSYYYNGQTVSVLHMIWDRMLLNSYLRVAWISVSSSVIIILRFAYFFGVISVIDCFYILVMHRSNHVLPCRPSGITLDIKKSSHKKLSKWLQSKSSSGLVSLLFFFLCENKLMPEWRKSFLFNLIFYLHFNLIPDISKGRQV